jgi:hypothetical protein
MSIREFATLFLAMTGALFWLFVVLLVIVPLVLHLLFAAPSSKGEP